ncbi:MAG: cardiolipin synthase, partial [Lactobacillales bacterium]|nr:cardiolipin synthase [Lactobacillales bacterium]
MNIWGQIITFIVFLNTIVAIYTVFHEKRDVTATWAWLLTLTMLPVVGFVMYFFIGKKMAADHIYDLKTQKSLG